MKEALTPHLLKYNPNFSSAEIDLGLSYFQSQNLKAKDLILATGQVCEDLLFMEHSVTRCFYFDAEGKEQTLWMKPEQTFLTEYKSFVHQEKSGFGLQVYEDTLCYRISRKNLLALYQQSNAWALFGLQLTEQLHITLIDVFVNLLANDATDNYRYIEYHFPRFLQVAPLKDIASMLQMSQVSLSRIRAGKQTKK